MVGKAMFAFGVGSKSRADQNQLENLLPDASAGYCSKNVLLRLNRYRSVKKDITMI